MDLAHLDATEHDRYFVDPGNTKKLFSVAGAAGPKPTDLYAKTTDTSTDDQPLNVWHPNVRLVSGQEQQQGPNAGQLSRWTEKLFRGVALENQPKIGLLGKNDCDFFAGVLTDLIAAENATYAEDTVGDQRLDLDESAAPELQVGDKMKHKFEGDQACGHHGATAVAKDGTSLVTLEAHVSKNLKAPDFHIREGVGGFVTDNDTNPQGLSRGLGSKVEIRTASGQTEDEVDGRINQLERRFRQIKGAEQVYQTPPEAFLGAGLGLTTEPGREVRRETGRRQTLQVIRTLLNRPGWGRQSSKTVLTKTFHFTPSGVSDLKKLANGDGSAANILRLLKAKATNRLTKDDTKRSQATAQLYATLDAMDPVNPDVGGITGELDTAEDYL